MSRAFVSESNDDFMGSDIPEAKYPLPEGTKNYMTPGGASKIRDELTELSKVRRPELIARISSAVTDETGALRESVLLDRRLLREVDRRIQYLTKMVDNLEIVEPGKQDTGRVLFGAKVTVLEENEGEKSYRIVGIDESDPTLGKVSWLSPVARALTGKRLGDTVAVKVPAGEMRLTIRRIDYE